MTVDPSTRRGRVLRHPFLHFFVLGGLLYLVVAWIEPPARPLQVYIGSAEIELLEAEWRGMMGRDPSGAELEGMIERRVDDALLIAEARARGWHESDAIVQRRLIKNQRFLEPDAGVDDATLLARAYAQGMDRSDLVVQRRLRELLKLMIADAARRPTPTREERLAHLAANAERFAIPPRVRITHVFLNRDRRGERLEADAEALLAQLPESGPDPETTAQLGDPFLLSKNLPLWPEAMLARQLGADFAAAAIVAPAGRWTGPLESSYGLHLVWVHESEPGAPAELDAVDKAVTAEILREREAIALRDFLQDSRARADIRIDRRP